MGKVSNWLYIGSIGLIIAAIAITSVIDRTKSGEEDIRAKAGVKTGQLASAVVSSLNEAAGALLVTNFVIGENGVSSANAEKIWTIALPSDADSAILAPGVRVRLILVPSSVNITFRTATALEVTTR